ncbi:hypothetical protein B0J14DRAFT_76241 [Halenospora varia]|nr:hypothetical protein B0J14DRAFT_76241 [Halenospora varia]
MASDLLQARAQHYGEAMALRDEAEYVERRRTQNRIAQRNFRKNEKERQARQAMENNSAKASITSAPRSHPQNFVPPTSWDQPAQSSGQSWPPPDDSAMDYSYSMPTSPLQINTFQDQPYPNQFDYSSLDSVLDSMCGQDMYAISASSTPTYSMTPPSTTPTYSMTPNSTTPPYSTTPAGSRPPAMSLQSTNSIPTLTLNNDINNQDNVMMEGHSRARSKTMPDELNVQNLDFFDHSVGDLLEWPSLKSNDGCSSNRYKIPTIWQEPFLILSCSLLVELPCTKPHTVVTKKLPNYFLTEEQIRML